MPVVRRLRHSLAPALAVVAAMALAGCGATQSDRITRESGRSNGARAEAANVRAGANVLLDGGPPAFRARLEALRGTPVVINQWASWCGPCRFEFPFFQRLAKRYVGRVAFLGVDSQDSRSGAREFLARFPVPYPQFYDKDASIARVFRAGRAWPTTAFYDAHGTLVLTHAGAYANEATLDEDIRRYALRPIG
jgi:thiol-disulfide isomerase/thioredoxin